MPMHSTSRMHLSLLPATHLLLPTCMTDQAFATYLPPLHIGKTITPTASTQSPMAHHFLIFPCLALLLRSPLAPSCFPCKLSSPTLAACRQNLHQRQSHPIASSTSSISTMQLLVYFSNTSSHPICMQHRAYSHPMAKKRDLLTPMRLTHPLGYKYP